MNGAFEKKLSVDYGLGYRLDSEMIGCTPISALVPSLLN